MYNIFAVIIGALISIMLTFNRMLEGNVGSSYSLITIHVVGLLLISTILLFRREKLKFENKIPFYLFLGGAIGVVLTLINMKTIGVIGVTLTTSCGVFGQLIFSALVDNYGWFGMDRYKFNKKKILGFLIIFIGLLIMSV